MLVTHDRYLLDRVSTRGLWRLDGKGNAKIFADLAQWERARETEAEEEIVKEERTGGGEARAETAKKKSFPGMSNGKLEGMEAAIHKAEAEVGAMELRVADPAVIADHIKMREGV